MLAANALGLISRADSARGVALALERVHPGGSERVRGQALSILRRPLAGSAEIERIFISLLRDRFRWIRWSALNGLADHGGTAAAAALKALADDPENDLAEQARKAAEKITTRLRETH
jgi:hypothetical protein